MIRPKLLTIGGDTEIYIGEAEYLTPGTYYFQVPLSMTRIHACCIGAGAQGATDGDGAGGDMWSGGGGGGLGWKNNIEVEPGEWLIVQVGQVVGAHNAPADDGASWIKRPKEEATFDVGSGEIIIGEPEEEPLVAGYAPAGNNFNSYGSGGTFFGDGGGNGGSGSYNSTYTGTDGLPKVKTKGSGGGAGGYMGNGGHGCTDWGNPGGDGGGGSGGAGDVKPTAGSRSGRRGGGVGVRGMGASGASVRPDLYDENGDEISYTEASPKVGLPGSGGEKELYGAGGAGNRDGWNGSELEKAGHGAVRIIWGNRFSYPDNADVTAE